MSFDDLASKASAAAHRARWLIEALEEAAQVLEDGGASDDARREEIASVDAAWEKLVGGPLKYRGGKFLREVLTQALGEAAKIQDDAIASRDFSMRVASTHPDEAKQLESFRGDIVRWIVAWRADDGKWSAVNDAAVSLGATAVTPESIRRDHQKWNEHFAARRGR